MKLPGPIKEKALQFQQGKVCILYRHTHCVADALAWADSAPPSTVNRPRHFYYNFISGHEILMQTSEHHRKPNPQQSAEGSPKHAVYL
jgi:hypothetical protein